MKDMIKQLRAQMKVEVRQTDYTPHYAALMIRVVAGSLAANQRSRDEGQLQSAD